MISKNLKNDFFCAFYLFIYLLIFSFIIHFFWKRATVTLNDERRDPNATIDAFLNAFVLNELGQKAADERVTSAVRVHDLLGLETLHRVLFHRLAVRQYHWSIALRDDHGSLAARVDFRHVGNVAGDLFNIGGLKFCKYF